MPNPKRRLTIRRKAFRVGPTTIERDGVTIRRKGFDVPAVTFTIKDRGAPGRGKDIIPKGRRGAMTKAAIDLGFIKKGQKVTDIPNSRMDDFGRALAKKVGATRAFRMFQAQIVFRKRTDSLGKKFQIGRDAIPLGAEK